MWWWWWWWRCRWWRWWPYRYPRSRSELRGEKFCWVYNSHSTLADTHTILYFQYFIELILLLLFRSLFLYYQFNKTSCAIFIRSNFLFHANLRDLRNFLVNRILVLGKFIIIFFYYYYYYSHCFLPEYMF